MKKVMYAVRSAAATIGVMAVPLAAFAQDAESIIRTVNRVLGLLIPIVFTVALLYFLWGLAQYILNAGDAEKQKEARDHMIWGIIALFVMIAVWGLVGVLGRTIGVQTGTALPLPGVPN